MNLNRLKEPFEANKIKWRVGATNRDKSKGLALAYIDARAVMERLDKVVGVANWQKTYDFGKNGEIICSIGIKVDGEWVFKSGGAGQTDFEGIKGGMSDSFKRAGVCWGIGRYLYDLPQNWVAIEKRGKSFVIKDTPKLSENFLPDDPIKKIRKAYQKDPVLAGETIKKFLAEAGLNTDLSNVNRLKENQAEKLLDKLKDKYDIVA